MAQPSSVGETVYQYPLEEYEKMGTYLSKDDLSGYALKGGSGKPDLDMVSVFNVGQRGMGKSAVRSAVQRGATTLDAFDESGFLPQIYGQFGFDEVGRDPWDPQFAPPGWQGGSPDVVYMRRQVKDWQRQASLAARASRHAGVDTSRSEARNEASRCCSGRWSRECHSR